MENHLCCDYRGLSRLLKLFCSKIAWERRHFFGFPLQIQVGFADLSIFTHAGLGSIADCEFKASGQKLDFWDSWFLRNTDCTELLNSGDKDMLGRTQFVIFKSDSCYSITECDTSGVKQVFLSDDGVRGDDSVLLRLSQIKPKDLSLEKYVEMNAGQLIFAD